MNLVDIIIPTYNNRQYLEPCIYSILKYRSSENIFHIYIVNNGHPESCRQFYGHNNITVLETGGENYGWMRAINYGIKNSKADFVCMMNDDTFIPQSSIMWLNVLLQNFLDPKVGGVGPTSNVVMGLQNIFANTTLNTFTTKFLIGFCVLYRRKAIEDVGLLDEGLPGGDDFDYAIRMTDKGWKLIINRNVFVYHHGFQTGNRLFGGSDRKGGWNSEHYTSTVNTAIIKKHGLKKWYELMRGAVVEPSVKYTTKTDSEEKIIRKRIRGKKVVEVGVGGKKTVKNSIGIDMIPKGDEIDTLNRIASVADIVADVSQPLPIKDNSVDCIIARHILEHVSDPIRTLIQWKDKLKKNGQIIIAVPNNRLIRSIPMNIEHQHGWTPESMKTLLEFSGFKIEEQVDSRNNVSFITFATKL